MRGRFLRASSSQRTQLSSGERCQISFQLGEDLVIEIRARGTGVKEKGVNSAVGTERLLESIVGGADSANEHIVNRDILQTLSLSDHKYS